MILKTIVCASEKKIKITHAHKNNNINIPVLTSVLSHKLRSR